MAGIERLNAEVDVRHRRRALSPEEFANLIQAARMSGEEIQCFDGETRARIYLVSYFTGLRRAEIASLTPSSFQFGGEQPTLTVDAACSKHRRRDVLPLHVELIALLRSWVETLPPDQPLFPLLAKRRTWLMVKKDLERAGIPYITKAGIADFHAAGRHTYITGHYQAGTAAAAPWHRARWRKWARWVIPCRSTGQRSGRPKTRKPLREQGFSRVKSISVAGCHNRLKVEAAGIEPADSLPRY
jgi:integrase